MTFQIYKKTVRSMINSEVGEKEKKQFKNVFIRKDGQIVSHFKFFSDHFVGVVQDLNLSTQDQALNIDVDNNFNNERFFKQHFI